MLPPFLQQHDRGEKWCGFYLFNRSITGQTLWRSLLAGNALLHSQIPHSQCDSAAELISTSVI